MLLALTKQTETGNAGILRRRNWAEWRATACNCARRSGRLTPRRWSELCRCGWRRDSGFAMPFATVLDTRNPSVNREILSKFPALESSCRQSQRGAISYSLRPLIVKNSSPLREPPLALLVEHREALLKGHSQMTARHPASAIATRNHHTSQLVAPSKYFSSQAIALGGK